MNVKGKIRYFSLFLALVVFIGGCRQVRLLEVKRQLGSFDTYFQVKEEHGPALVFLRPVLLQSDILWLTQEVPTTNEVTDEGILWTYVFEKQSPARHSEEPSFAIDVSMLFQNRKLYEVRYPHRFHTVLSKDFLIGTLRSLAHAEINITKRSLSAKWTPAASSAPITMPDRYDLIRVLGNPFSVENSKHASTLTYKYQFKGPSCRRERGESRLWVTFIFRRADEQLLQTKAHFNGREISVHFSPG